MLSRTAQRDRRVPWASWMRRSPRYNSDSPGLAFACFASFWDLQVEDLHQRGESRQCCAPADGLFAEIDQEVPVEGGVRSIEDARESMDTPDSSW